jgi:hypothetical protein
MGTAQRDLIRLVNEGNTPGKELVMNRLEPRELQARRHPRRGEDFWYPPDNAGAWPDHPATDPTEASKGDKGNLVAHENNAPLMIRSGAALDATVKVAVDFAPATPAR